MYKVFFNDRIVFINAYLNKSLIKNSLLIEVSKASDLQKIWSRFIEDPLEQNLFLKSEAVEDVKIKFFGLFEIIEASGGIVYNNSDQILCIFRLGKWDLPKGKIEEGESKELAAVREVEEETGISNVKLMEEVETTFHIYQSPYHQNRWVLKPTYWFRMKYDGNELLVPQTKESITDVKWVDEHELDEVRQNTYASLRDLI